MGPKLKSGEVKLSRERSKILGLAFLGLLVLFCASCASQSMEKSAIQTVAASSELSRTIGGELPDPSIPQEVNMAVISSQVLLQIRAGEEAVNCSGTVVSVASDRRRIKISSADHCLPTLDVQKITAVQFSAPLAGVPNDVVLDPFVVETSTPPGEKVRTDLLVIAGKVDAGSLGSLKPIRLSQEPVRAGDDLWVAGMFSPYVRPKTSGDKDKPMLFVGRAKVSSENPITLRANNDTKSVRNALFFVPGKTTMVVKGMSGGCGLNKFGELALVSGGGAPDVGGLQYGTVIRGFGPGSGGDRTLDQLILDAEKNLATKKSHLSMGPFLEPSH